MMNAKKNKGETKVAGAEAAGVMVRVRVLKHRLRVGDFIHAEGAEIVLPREEFELREGRGEIELIGLAAE